MNPYRYLVVSVKPKGVVVSLLSHVLKIDAMKELRDAISRAEGRGIVIHGTSGYFAAGADIGELSELSGPDALEYARFGQGVMNAIADHPSVTIAAIDGYCMGGGLDLALSCDLRYATAASLLAHPGGRIGIMTGWGGTRRLPLMIGKSRTLEMMAAGRRVTAYEALEWGLVNGLAEDPVAHALQTLKNIER